MGNGDEVIEEPREPYFARVSLNNGKDINKGIHIALYMPLQQVGERELLFTPCYYETGWPPAHGMWEGKKVFGEVEWDKDEEHLTIEWSDGDRTTLDLDENMEVKSGRIITFASQRHDTKTQMTIGAIRLL